MVWALAGVIIRLFPEQTTNQYGSAVETIPLEVYGPPQAPASPPTSATAIVGQSFPLPSVPFTSSTPTNVTVCLVRMLRSTLGCRSGAY